VVAKETEEEAWRLPEIWRGPATVEEALEINPFPTVSIPVVEALVRVVTPVTVNVPVAMIFGAVRVPVNNPVPWTARRFPGVVVPMPTFE